MSVNKLIYIEKFLLVVNHSIAKSLIEIAAFWGGIINNTHLGILACLDLIVPNAKRMNQDLP
ncbi:hypothetical protein CXF95_07975 [Paraglaciecola sp. MB-3u-78]|nr:hypothetical protein CXF95_07975 [Paraglaciecola sp. MB-3u-78]